MPDDDLTQELFGDADLTDQLFGSGAATATDEADPVGGARELAEGAPPRQGEVTSALTQLSPEEKQTVASNFAGAIPLKEGNKEAYADAPWYEQLHTNLKDSPLYSPAATFFENALGGLTSETADELQAQSIAHPKGLRAEGYMNAAPVHPPERGKWGPPPTLANADYAAGSEAEDIRRTLVAEKLDRDKEGGIVPTVAGKVAGGVAQSLAIPGKAGAQAVGNVVQVGSSMLGSGSGDLSQRADQAVQAAEESPWWTAASLAPTALAAVQPVLQKGAQAARTAQYTNRGAAVMPNIADRAAYVKAKGGNALEELGRNVEKYGLHETPWYQLWAPSSSTYLENSRKLSNVAGPRIGEAEAEIAATANPVNVSKVSEQLDESAKELDPRELAHPKAEAEAKYRRNIAERFRNIAKEDVQGPVPAEEIPSGFGGKGRTETVQGTEFQTQPFFKSGASRNYTPTPEELAEYERAMRRYGRMTAEPELPQITRFEGPEPAPIGPEEWANTIAGAEAKPVGALPEPAYPTEAQIKGYDVRLARARENQANLPVPEKPEPLTFSGPQQVTPVKTGPQEVTRMGPDLPPTFKEGPALEPFQDTTVPFTKAMNNLREEAKQIDWLAPSETARMQEKVGREASNTLRSNITEALDSSVAEGKLSRELVDDWEEAKKQYHVAKTVEEPSVVAGLKEYDSSLGLKDMAGTTLLSAVGLPGPAAVLAAKHLASPGRLLSTKAGAYSKAGTALETASAAGSRATAIGSPITQAQQALDPRAPKNEVVTKANDDLKGQMQQAQQSGNDWWDYITKIPSNLPGFR